MPITDKLYIVKYSKGSYTEINLFVTNKKSTATKYVTKFNKLLKKLELDFKKFEDTKLGMSWIADKYVEKHYRKWSKVREINRSWWEEIEIR